MIAHLFRIRRSSHGTEGIFAAGAFSCFTMELPWKDNRPNISCIPAGRYKVTIRVSPRFGQVYHVTEVEGRSSILIHSGNFAGDKSLGLRTHSQGCILVGKYTGILEGQRAVLASRITLRRLLDFCGGQDFTLRIQEAF